MNKGAWVSQIQEAMHASGGRTTLMAAGELVEPDRLMLANWAMIWGDSMAKLYAEEAGR